jgi:phosphohistidine phosphatase
MLTLYLTRHAKSSKEDPQLRDIDRPLNDRGVSDAALMAERFAARNEPVDLLVSSTALRASTTARAFAKALGFDDGKITGTEDIYLADTNVLLRVVNALPDNDRRIMLFGHNPGFSALAEALVDEGLGELPTCATVRIDFDLVSWDKVSRGAGKLVWIDFPSKHRTPASA